MTTKKDPFTGVANAENLSPEDRQRLLALADAKRPIKEVDVSNITAIIIDVLTTAIGTGIGYFIALELIKQMIEKLI